MNGESLVHKRQTGITLIELMTVMVIVAVLTAIAVPSYRNYLIRSNRSEAKAALIQYSAMYERCFTQFSSYATADGCTIALPYTVPSGNYILTAGAGPAATSFTLQATPLKGQQEDTQCGAFTLSSTNLRGVTGTLAGTPAQCWSR